MRRTFVPAVTAGAIMLVAAATSALAQDQSRAVSGGGISVPGWAGKADGGGKVEEAKLTKDGNNLHVTTGPAVAYWNPANKASGNYTVKATFNEAKYMNLNGHPHPYGVFIGGNDLGTDQQTYLYCAAYGNGSFIVRGFGPAAFQLNGRGESNAAVHKAANKGDPVTQEIALSVKGDDVTCSVNGTVVGTYKKADIVGSGKLKSLDGVYGIRFGHNTEATVSGLTMTKN